MKSITGKYSDTSIEIEMIELCFSSIIQVYNSSSFVLKTGYKEYENDLSKLKEISSIDDIEKIEIEIMDEDGKQKARVEFNHYWTLIILHVSSATQELNNKSKALIERTLNLIPPTKEDERNVANLYNINQNVLMVLDKLTREEVLPNKTQKVFLSFRFDDHSKSLALELKEFLEIVDFDVITGLGTEPRSVSKKVLERIKTDISLFIIIMTESGKSDWLNQELGAAKALEIPILILVEKNADKISGISGDNEYVEFTENTISKTFVPVLQSIKYLNER